MEKCFVQTILSRIRREEDEYPISEDGIPELSKAIMNSEPEDIPLAKKFQLAIDT